MNKKEARDLIKYHLDNNSILHPDEVRDLYKSAGYPTPPHLIKEVLTEEEIKHRADIAKKLFYSQSALLQGDMDTEADEPHHYIGLKENSSYLHSWWDKK